MTEFVVLIVLSPTVSPPTVLSPAVLSLTVLSILTVERTDVALCVDASVVII